MSAQRGQVLFLRLWLAAVLVLAAGCGSDEPERASRELRRYPVTGQVVVVASSISHVAVRHGRIPGWGQARVTDFPVKEKSALKQLRVGDRIVATIFQKGPEYWLGDIRVVKRGEAAPAKAR